MYVYVVLYHDDVIKWKHFPRYWPFVRGIHLSPVNSPHKGQWRGALMFTLICARINVWVNNREAGDLRRNRVHYDVIVMMCMCGCKCMHICMHMYVYVYVYVLNSLHCAQALSYFVLGHRGVNLKHTQQICMWMCICIYICTSRVQISYFMCQ